VEALHIPRICAWEQSDICELGNMLRPPRFRLCRCIHGLLIIFVAVLDSIKDPVTLELNNRWAVGECSWSCESVELAKSYSYIVPKDIEGSLPCGP